MDLISRAKINLSLRVIDRLKNGYHLIETIMQSISLEDKISINELDSNEIKISSNSNQVPTGKANIVYKAVELIKDRYDIDKGLHIHIEKHIPIAAGMAGGSSNGAAVLFGLNKLWNLGLSEEDLNVLALDLGADVPFCLVGGSCLSEGVGEKLTRLRGLDEKVGILICKPDISIATEDSYEYYDKEIFAKNLRKKIDTHAVKEVLHSNKLNLLKKYSGNDLDLFARVKCPQIDSIMETMNKAGADFSMVSGSGPSVFALFTDLNKLESCFTILKESYKDTYKCFSASKGVELIG